jgi:hypothetical protein
MTRPTDKGIRRLRLDNKLDNKLVEQVYGENFADAVVMGYEILTDIENIRDDEEEEIRRRQEDMVRAAMWSMPYEWLEAEITRMER